MRGSAEFIIAAHTARHRAQQRHQATRRNSQVAVTEPSSQSGSTARHTDETQQPNSINAKKYVNKLKEAFQFGGLSIAAREALRKPQHNTNQTSERSR